MRSFRVRALANFCCSPQLLRTHHHMLRFCSNTSAQHARSPLVTAWETNAIQYKDNTAVIQDDFHVSYGHLDTHIKRLCSIFANEYHLTKGDFVMHFSEQRIETLAIMVACAKSGLIYSPILATVQPPQISNLMANCAVSLVITESKFASNINAAQYMKDHNIPMLQLPETFDFEFNGTHSDDSAKSASASAEAEITEHDRYLTLCTSGTTGAPKMCLYSHKGIHSSAAKNFANFVGPSVPGKDLTLVVNNIYAPTGPMHRWSVLLEGSTIVLPNKEKANDIAHWHYLCEEKHPNISRATFFGRSFSDVAHLNKKFHNLSAVLYTGDFVPFKAVAHLKKNLMTQTHFVHGYGCSEAMMVAMLDPGILANLVKEHSVDAENVLIPAGTVVNDASELKVDSETNEIFVRHDDDSGMIGYLNRQELTAEVIASDGWYATGDLGRIGDDGLLYVLGRKKDIIISSTGVNVYPVEIEQVLMRHWAVQEAAVVGYPNSLIDEFLPGEVPIAFVALGTDFGFGDLEENEKVKAVEKELMALCAACVDPIMMIRAVFCVEELPKTNARKLSKNALREQIQNGIYKIS